MNLQRVMIALLLTALVLEGVSGDVTCTPAEEDQRHSIECIFPTTKTTLTWTLRTNVVLCTCSLSDTNGCTCKGDYEATVGQETADSNTSSLTIINPTRSPTPTTYRCLVGTEVKGSCQLKVFVKPENPSCDPPDVDENGIVSVTCTADDVYPNGSCRFFLRTNGTVPRELSPAVSLTGSPYSCTKTVSGNVLQWGRHEFQAKMYPYIDGQMYDSGESSSQFTPEVLIENPHGVLSTDCPTGDKYIKENITGTCTCNRTDQSVLPTTVRWSSHMSGNPHSDVLMFEATRHSTGFMCLITNGISWSYSVEFSPAVAYGPGTVGVQEETGKNVFHYCGSPVQIQARCQVSATDVNPAPIFYITFQDNPTRPGILGSEVDGVYSHLETQSISHGGLYVISCNVSNSKAEGLSSVGTTDLTITESPSPPVLEILQGIQSISVTNVTLKEGNATFRCHIQDGFPRVANITISCGPSNLQNTTTWNTNEIKLSLQVSRRMMGDSCSCSVEHLSICYLNKMKTTAPFSVLYPASVSNFTVSSKSSAGLSVTVAKGDSVTFDCQTDGSPKPKGEITMERFPNISQSDVKDNLQCTDTGTYVCQARNEEGSEEPLKKEVQVNVNCSFQLEHPEENGRIHNGTRDENFNISVHVFGFPPPPKTGFKLVEKNENTSTHRRSSSYMVQYDVQYIDDKAPHGRVQLTIQKLRQSDFKNYTLVIENDIGTLEYDFGISEENKTAEPYTAPPPIAAIVGGIVAGILVIVIGVVVYCVLKRRGVLDRCQQGPKAERMHAHQERDNEVTISNMDIYNENKPQEVVMDNMDIYAMNRNRVSEEVVVDNSALYGKAVDYNGKRKTDSMYKNYSEVVPSITSATAAPRNLTNNPYEDVGVSHSQVQPKPQVAMKPKPAPKPQSVAPTNNTVAREDDRTDQTYATVFKTPKSGPKVCEPVKDDEDFIPDQSEIPVVPEKKYEKNDKNVKKKKKDEEKKQKGSGKKDESKQVDEMPMLPRGNTTIGSPYEDVDPSPVNVYANSGFTDTSDELNVYANTDKIQDEYSGNGNGDGTKRWP